MARYQPSACMTLGTNKSVLANNYLFLCLAKHSLSPYRASEGWQPKNIKQDTSLRLV